MVNDQSLDLKYKVYILSNISTQSHASVPPAPAVIVIVQVDIESYLPVNFDVKVREVREGRRWERARSDSEIIERTSGGREEGEEYSEDISRTKWGGEGGRFVRGRYVCQRFSQCVCCVYVVCVLIRRCIPPPALLLTCFSVFYSSIPNFKVHHQPRSLAQTLHGLDGGGGT